MAIQASIVCGYCCLKLEWWVWWGLKPEIWFSICFYNTAKWAV